jgi:hypothetical protein
MPQIVANPPSSSCYHLYPEPRIQRSQGFNPDPSSFTRAGKSGQSPELLMDRLLHTKPSRIITADKLRVATPNFTRGVHMGETKFSRSCRLHGPRLGQV